MRTRPRLTPRFLYLLCLGWLLVICVTSALGGVFQVVEEPPHDPTVRGPSPPALSRGERELTSAVYIAEGMYHYYA